MPVIPAWHPIVVHFPLALVLVAVGCLSLARWLPGSPHAGALAIVGTWNLCIGAAAAFLALGTGLAAAIGLNLEPPARTAITIHVKWAILATFLVLSAAVWRGAGTRQVARPSLLFLAILWAAGAALTVTGYRGGQNVYRYGVGVLPAALHAAPAGR